MKKFNNKSIVSLAAMAALSTLLSACGGGGSSSDGTDSVTSGPNAFKDMQVTYAVACKGWQETTYTAGVGVTPSANVSDQGSVAITALVGTDRANVTVHATAYKSAPNDPAGSKCDPAALTEDITVTGQIRDLGTTKLYAAPNGPAGAKVTAKVVEFTYYGFTMAKGVLSGVDIPTPNMTTQVAYLIDGDKLYLGSGGRGADGLALHLATRFGVKQ